MAYPNPGTYSPSSPQVARIVNNTVPFVNAPTGTMGNNGAITIGTALANTYPTCYLYLPAGAIQTNSPAGWFYAVMTSTTLGTVYNFPYSNGVPQVPLATSLAGYAFSSTGPGAYTGVTTAVIGPQITIPQGSMSVGSQLRVVAYHSLTNNADGKTITVNLGGTNLFNASEASVAGYLVDQMVVNQGNLSNQVMFTNTVATEAPTYLTLNTATDLVFYVGSTKATATDYMTLETVAVELIV
jgi:hypothetical protein